MGHFCDTCPRIEPPYIFLFFETEGRHANAKAQEAYDHMASIISSIDHNSQPGIEPLTSS